MIWYDVIWHANDLHLHIYGYIAPAPMHAQIHKYKARAIPDTLLDRQQQPVDVGNAWVQEEQHQ